jgi:hypothetical protein
MAHLVINELIIVYLFCPVDSIIKKGRVGISLTSLTLPHFHTCLKPKPGISIVVCLFFLCSISWGEIWLLFLLFDGVYRIYNYLGNQCLSPLLLWVRISIRARHTTISDKVCQWLATDRWFSPGIQISSTNKTDNHDITETLLKVALSTENKFYFTSIRTLIWHHTFTNLDMTPICCAVSSIFRVKLDIPC